MEFKDQIDSLTNSNHTISYEHIPDSGKQQRDIHNDSLEALQEGKINIVSVGNSCGRKKTIGQVDQLSFGPDLVRVQRVFP